MARPVKTIGNPVSWTLDAVAGSSRYVADAAGEIGSGDATPPQVAHLEIEDLKVALRKGYDDFRAFRTDVMFIVVLYPVIGICLAALAFNREFLPLLFPLMSGFALIGPVAATGLYEMSRRRERGEEAGWGAAFGAFGSPAIGAILTLGFYLLVIFVAWMLTAYLIYSVTLGPEPPLSVGSFLTDVFTTGAGWVMLIVGCGVGFLFAALTLSISIVSIPLLLHRHVGVPRAIATSVEVASRNPRPTAAWGAIVAGALVLGTIPLFLGLIFVLPILGHATWHLYRRAVN
jgi:uncharacterized membrane protein